MSNDTNKELLNILFEKSFRYDPSFGFKLASGTKSDIYVDVKKTVLSPEGMELMGEAMYEKLKDLDFDGIGGLTLGADPISYSTGLICKQKGKPVEVYVVRKQVKDHGTGQSIEGNLTEGAKVVVVDDVVTTGGSTIQAIERVKEAGFEIVAVVSVVDRQEGGRENIKEACGIDLMSLFTRDDLISLYKG